MKTIVFYIAAGISFSVVGEYCKCEHDVQICGCACNVKNAITNVLFDVYLMEKHEVEGLKVGLIKPNIQSCLKFCENGEVHFADVDCGVHLKRMSSSTGNDIRNKLCFGNFKCWQVESSHGKDADYCGAGWLKFYIDDVFSNRTNLLQISKAEFYAECRTAECEGKYFLASGVRRLVCYEKAGKSVAYLSHRFDPKKCLMLSYELWAKNVSGLELCFVYDIIRVEGNAISSICKGELQLAMKDRGMSHVEDVQITLSKVAECNYVLHVEYDGVGCPIRVSQYDINEAIAFEEH